ncbi:hypothetical protein QBC46DRAFT_411514 [Diplogelasinospora grovesii]|uniref:Uncharacterized protein n=1 Tax=Diplogelasinospora grovesii TaxID=303347 RepID=A0AAN6N0P2_9PEZI|nr:hypothetical protein QBC46DRAFT_411514 [Diplogelasinospora grovesii]
MAYNDYLVQIIDLYRLADDEEDDNEGEQQQPTITEALNAAACVDNNANYSGVNYNAGLKTENLGWVLYKQLIAVFTIEICYPIPLPLFPILHRPCPHINDYLGITIQYWAPDPIVMWRSDCIGRWTRSLYGVAMRPGFFPIPRRFRIQLADPDPWPTSRPGLSITNVPTAFREPLTANAPTCLSVDNSRCSFRKDHADQTRLCFDRSGATADDDSARSRLVLRQRQSQQLLTCCSVHWLQARRRIQSQAVEKPHSIRLARAAGTKNPLLPSLDPFAPREISMLG